MSVNSNELLSEDERFLLDDLRENHAQSSWDWPADERFAEHVGDGDNLITESMESGAPSAFRIAAAKTWERITQRRLRALRALVKRGLVVAFWSGTGPGGFTDFGVRRVRTYDLPERYR